MKITIRTVDRKDWRTPRAFFQALDAEFNFTLDVAATENNKLRERLENGLEDPWSGRCWMNPPYGRDIYGWIQKACQELSLGNAELVVALLPAKTDTIWFHELCAQAEVRFIRGRLLFDDGKGRATFPSMVVIWRR